MLAECISGTALEKSNLIKYEMRTIVEPKGLIFASHFSVLAEEGTFKIGRKYTLSFTLEELNV